MICMENVDKRDSKQRDCLGRRGMGFHCTPLVFMQPVEFVSKGYGMSRGQAQRKSLQPAWVPLRSHG